MHLLSSPFLSTQHTNMSQVLALCPNCHQSFFSGQQLSAHVAKCITFLTHAPDEGTINFGNLETLAMSPHSPPQIMDGLQLEMPCDDNNAIATHSLLHLGDSMADPVIDPHLSSMPPHPHFSQDDMVHVKLLRICSEMNLPLYSYDVIMKWSQQSYSSGYQFPRSAPTRQKLLYDLYQLYGMQNCKPTLHDVQLSFG